MNKKVIFWIVIVIAILVLALLIWLKEANWGPTIFAVLSGILGILVGWVVYWFYKKYVSPDTKE